MARLAFLFITLVGLCTTPAWAQSVSPRFDGSWSTQLSCDAVGSAAGYINHLTLTIRNGQITGSYVGGNGSQMRYSGKVEPNGSALIMVDGRSESPKHAIDNAAPGARISFQLAVQFSDRNGSGKRTAGRPCTVSMSRL